MDKKWSMIVYAFTFITFIVIVWFTDASSDTHLLADLIMMCTISLMTLITYQWRDKK